MLDEELDEVYNQSTQTMQHIKKLSSYSIHFINQKFQISNNHFHFGKLISRKTIRMKSNTKNVKALSVSGIFAILEIEIVSLYDLKERRSMKEETNEKAQQHEDIALKLSTQFFAQELLPYFGIKGKVVGIAPTELVQIELHRQNQDFNLVMEDGSWIHFEFQSTNEGVAGLKRFRNYEATASYQHDVPITTYVLYSGKIKNPVTEFTEGVNTYRVIPIIMRKDDADKLLDQLEEKVKSGEKITKEDIVPLILCPLMGGKSSIKDRIKRSLNITRVSKDVAKEDVDRIETVIYAMADKFLEKVELEEVWEMMKMTTLGEILMREGRQEGKNEKMVDQIKKKLVKGKSVAVIADELEETEEMIEKMIKEYDL